MLDGADDRLLVVTGPCSVHDPKAALDYAARLAELRDRYADDLLIVMRVYFEKPRTVTGWKGLINDPGMDGSFDVHRGLRTARRLLLDIVGAGHAGRLRVAGPDHPAVHRRHRDLGRDRRADHREPGAPPARLRPVDAGRASRTAPTATSRSRWTRAAPRRPATRSSASPRHGAAAVVTTSGNSDTHVILRGGRSGPNYSASHVAKALDLVAAAGLPRRLMVDASHGNSGKDYTPPARRRRVAGGADHRG